MSNSVHITVTSTAAVAKNRVVSVWLHTPNTNFARVSVDASLVNHVQLSAVLVSGVTMPTHVHSDSFDGPTIDNLVLDEGTDRIGVAASPGATSIAFEVDTASHGQSRVWVGVTPPSSRQSVGLPCDGSVLRFQSSC